MGDRYDRLQPPNLTASVASMPRRWKDALHLPPPKNIEEVFTTVGPDGVSAAEDCGAVLAQVATLTNAIRTTSYNAPEALDSTVVAALANQGSGPWPATAGAALENLTAAFENLDNRLKDLKANDWNKTAPTPSGSISLIDLVRGVARVSADRLARVERTVQSFR